MNRYPHPPNAKTQVMTNEIGETLFIFSMFVTKGTRYFVVDSEDDRLFEYLANRMKTKQDFLNFIYRRSVLSEIELVELLNRFEFIQSDKDISGI